MPDDFRWCGDGYEPLSPEERDAVRHLIERILDEVPAQLVQASLFGSQARGEARRDSDIDVLLVFRRLPWDREPQASQAESIAEEVAAASGVPVTVWSVSLIDLEPGNRTPMLVDALEDSRPLWCEDAPLPAPPFTPADALGCVSALLDRVAEGEQELTRHMANDDEAAADRRLRDDLVRMCIALHLLRGVTRPRRGEAARGVLRMYRGELPPNVQRALRWAASSYGANGSDDESAVPPPPDRAGALRTVGTLRREVNRQAERLARRTGRAGTPRVAHGY